MRTEISGLFDLDTPIGEVARACPAAIDILEHLDIEYACNGRQSLSDAAEAAGVPPILALRRVNAAAAELPLDDEPTLEDLVERVLIEHHREERQRMGVLDHILSLDVGHSDTLGRLQRLAARLEATIRQHMDREEHDLFPAVERLATASTGSAVSIARRIYVEFVEHDTIHDMLIKLRELRLRASLEGCDERITTSLLTFERQTLRHIHIENNVLLPKALEAENRLKARRDVSEEQHAHA